MLCVYDTETTGLPSNHKDLPGIIQIAAILYDKDGNEIDTHNTRVNPELKDDQWEAGAIKVNGITPDMTRDWPTFFQILPAFAKFMRRATVLSGYNILGFDDDVLYKQLVRYGFEKNFPWPYHRLDVMDLAKAHHNEKGKRGNKRPKLTAIYKELFGEELEGAHDALNDVRGTGRVAFEIGTEEIARLL
jgi:DNA polymerase-3 subunit epsilon